MQLSGNTVLVTGGGSGIGRGIAEGFHRAGSQVIVAGRRRSVLEDVCSDNPGMTYELLDIGDQDDIAAMALRVINAYPELNVLVNNAGIMRGTSVGKDQINDKDLTAIVTTNLLGPIRLTSQLLGQLKDKGGAAKRDAHQAGATIINVTSGLAYVPMASVAIYCATKAALHSYTLSLRWDLRNSGVRVRELIPPYVQTELFRGASDPRAMPLNEYTTETMRLLAEDDDEVIGGRGKMLRPAGAAESEWERVASYNKMVEADPH